MKKEMKESTLAVLEVIRLSKIADMSRLAHVIRMADLRKRMYSGAGASVADLIELGRLIDLEGRV